MNEMDMTQIPRHIAIIMDGNGRWAQKHKLPRSAGHQQGVEAIRDVIKMASQLKVRVLTLYAFSTENWKRPEEEVSFLMKLLVEYLKKEIEELHKQNVIIRTIGDLSAFPLRVQREIEKAKEKTAANNGLIMNIALNYGSRNEIGRALKTIAEKYKEQIISSEDFTDEIIGAYLDTKGLPDPDLLIRTSGEKRISNFLLWQIAYAELYFTDVLWPDFRGEDLIKAIVDYQLRQRRFGGLG